MRSFRSYLLTLVSVVVLMAAAAFVLITQQASRASRQEAEAQLQEAAQVLSRAVDGELRSALGILSALRASEAVAQRDWAEVDRQARTAVTGADAWVLVQDRSGQQLVNTRLPPGSALPKGSSPAHMWREISGGEPRICDLATGIVERSIVCVDMPIMRGGRAEHAISMVLRPTFFESVVRREGVERGHIAALIDETGRLIWRNIEASRFVGRPATPQVRAAIRQSAAGVLEGASLDGTRMVAAHSRSALSGWSVVVAIPVEQAGAAVRQAQLRGSLLALAILASGAMLALMMARRLSRAVKQLSATAGADGTGEPPHPTGIVEIDDVAAAFRQASEARLESEQRSREAEAATRVSEERFRRIFEQTSDLVITADLDQVITDCNPAAAEAVGLSRSDAIGRKISDFISAEDFGRTTHMLRQKLERGGTTRYDVRVRSHSGEWLFWEINSGLTFDDAGKPVGLHVVGRDVTERKRFERHQQLLVGELNHRVKNTLAIVQSLAHQTFRKDVDPEQATASYEGRLRALAAAHNLLTSQSWSHASIRDVIAEALAPFCTDRCNIEGEDLSLAPQTAVSIALALHELATNAAKYGALSNDVGRIDVRWTVDGEKIELVWRERGGPPVSKPAHSGFGTRLIKRTLATELSGRVELDFDEAGLICQVQGKVPRPQAAAVAAE